MSLIREVRKSGSFNHGWIISGNNRYASARYYAEPTREFFDYTMKINVHRDILLIMDDMVKVRLSDLFVDVLVPTGDEKALFMVDYDVEYPTSVVNELTRRKIEDSLLRDIN